MGEALPRSAPQNRKPVAGIILAAGTGSRMGALKQCLSWQGRPILAHVIENAMAAPLSPLILVLGHEAKKIRQELAGTLPLDQLGLVLNPDFHTGMAGSLKAGLAALMSRALFPAGALFLLGDQPRIGPHLMATLAAKAREDRIVVPFYQGRRGNPVCFGAEFFPELLHLSGDQGGRPLLDRYPERIIPVETHDPAVCQDLDVPADYQALTGPPPTDCHPPATPLIRAMALSFPAIVTAVGGGGKTSLLFALAMEAATLGCSVLLTTTTAMCRPDLETQSRSGPDIRLFLGPARDMPAPGPGEILVAARQAMDLGPHRKIKGYTPEDLAPKLSRPWADLILIEGDGAKMKPVKAPAGHEPVIPAQTRIVAGCIGLDCLGQALDEAHVHRPELLARISGQTQGSAVDADTLARLIGHDQGLFKGAPGEARRVLVLNKADTPGQTARAVAIMARLDRKTCRLSAGLATCLACPENPVKAIL